MSNRFVNLALFVDTIALLASGILLFTTNRAQDAWLYQVHGFAGAALLILLIPKTRIIFRALARRWRQGSWLNWVTLAGIGLTALLGLSLVLALAWTLNALPFYLNIVLYITPLGLHWYLAFALTPFFTWHVVKRWVPFQRRAGAAPPGQPAISRRTAVNWIAVGTLGLLGWSTLEGLAATTGWTRRFTGSRLVNSFEANNFPVTSSEPPPSVDLAEWRLRVTGRVEHSLELTYSDLVGDAVGEQEATVDCTLGWASTQMWHGASVASLLERAGMVPGAREVSFRTQTGYSATLTLDECRGALIATHVGGQVLSQVHGFPARLVAPTRRGYHWVKWVSELVVS